MISKKNKFYNLFFLFFFFLITVFLIFKFGIQFITYFSSLFLKKIGVSEQNSIFIPAPYIYSQYQATNSAQINIIAKSYIDGKIKIFLNGKPIKEADIKRNTKEAFEVEIQEGENNIYAVVQNEKGQKSSPSNSLLIKLKTTSPALEIFSPTDGYTTNQKNVQITGKTEEEALVFINDRLPIIEKDGEFNYFYTLNDGENKINIKAQDKVGNINEKELTIFYTP